MSESQSPAPAQSAIKPRVRAVLDRVHSGRVLDVGAVGQGAQREDVNWLHGHLDTIADDLVGIDIDKEGVSELAADGWDVRVDDAETLATVPDDSFDYVVAAEVIEHLSAPGDFLENAARVLNPGGRVVLTTPNPWAACYVKRVALGAEPVGNEEHTCWIDATTIEQLAARYGLDGKVVHLPPQSRGICSVAYRFSDKLGGTRILADLEVVGYE